MSDILAKLQALGVTKGMPLEGKKLPAKPMDPIAALKSAFPRGFVEENEYGPCFINRLTYPLASSHGCVALDAPLENSDAFNRLLGMYVAKATDTLAMDTETSGLSSVSAAFVFMIGLGYFSDDAYVVDQLILPDLSYEKAFLFQIEKIFSRFRTLLTYNGKSFDLPMLNSRASFQGFPFFYRQIEHIDFLPLVRRYWRKELENCRLCTVEKDLLKLQRGEEEVPGYMAPELYREFLSAGEASVLSGIAYHNQIDVLSLSAFLLFLNQMANSELPEDEFYEMYNLPAEAYQRKMFLADPLSENPAQFCNRLRYSAAERKKIARVYEKHGSTAGMVRIYQSLAEENDLDSLLKLAAYFGRNPETFSAALIYLESALAVLESDESLGQWTKKDKIKAVQKQMAQLIKKQEKANDTKE